MKIYVASSWRNEYYPSVLVAIQKNFSEVYDFRKPHNVTTGETHEGFSWSQCNQGEKPIKWVRGDIKSGSEINEILKHPRSEEAFTLDRSAVDWADVVVLVLPSGRSAHLEAGYAAGSGKRLFIFIPEDQEPELMYKWADAIVDSIPSLLDELCKVSNN